MKLFLALLVLIAPCNGTNKIFKSTNSITNDVIIEYQTGACYGHCPIFSLVINGKSKGATFIGKTDIDKIGTYTKSISAVELDQLIKAFDDAQFFSLEDKYLGQIVDFPHRNINYTKNGKTKKIEVRSDVPKALTDIEALLNNFVNSEGWKKEETQQNPKD